MDVREDYRKMLKKRFLKVGLKGFVENEVIELLLTYAVQKGDVRQMAKALLDRYGDIQGILDSDIKELISLPGMNINSAILIKMAKDYPDFYLKDRVLNKIYTNSWLELIKYCQLSMAGLKNEQFRVVFLNTQNFIIDIETLHEGTIDQSVVYPRRIIERALHHNAVGLIFVHNHPTGSVNPSAADIDITNTLTLAASSMDIDVHDHLIIGKNRYFSFKDEGILAEIPEKFVSVQMKRN